MKTTGKYKLLGPVAAAAALSITGITALAESADTVTLHPPDVTAQQYGRSSNPAWESRQPTSLPEPVVKAYEKTKEYAANAYDKTKSIVTQPPGVPPNEPQRYGRAGGFVGLEQFQARGPK
jgi:hypothetical protein